MCCILAVLHQIHSRHVWSPFIQQASRYVILEKVEEYTSVTMLYIGDQTRSTCSEATWEVLLQSTAKVVYTQQQWFYSLWRQTSLVIKEVTVVR